MRRNTAANFNFEFPCHCRASTRQSVAEIDSRVKHGNDRFATEACKQEKRMPITKKNCAVKSHFIFSAKNILAKKNPQGGFDLPGAEFFERFVSEQKRQGLLCDAICETPQNYASALVKEIQGESSVAIQEGFEFVPLREFCFENESASALAFRAKGIVSWHDTYRHCPKCGAPLFDDESDTALFCRKCEFRLFPRIEPCVIVIIHRGDEILLVRNKHFGAKFFSHISGFVELGESAENAVRREAMEEVGISLKNIAPLSTQSWPFPDQLMLAYSAEYAGGELVLQEDEIAEARFFKRDRLPSENMLPLRGSVAWKMIYGKK